MGELKKNGVWQGDLVSYLTNNNSLSNELADDHETFRLLVDELRTDLGNAKTDLTAIKAAVTSLSAVTLTITTITATAPATLTASQLSLTQ